VNSPYNMGFNEGDGGRGRGTAKKRSLCAVEGDVEKREVGGDVVPQKGRRLRARTFEGDLKDRATTGDRVWLHTGKEFKREVT